MNKMPGNQTGSAILTIIVLMVLAYGVFVGIQYVPLRIESHAVDSVLDSVEISQKANPLRSVKAIEDKVADLLYVNEMKEMKDSFKVSRSGDSFIVKVRYDRELDMIYGNKVLQYDKSLTLR